MDNGTRIRVEAYSIELRIPSRVDHGGWYEYTSLATGRSMLLTSMCKESIDDSKGKQRSALHFSSWSQG